MDKIAEIYGEFNNLECFVHPIYKKRFKFLTIPQTVNLAKKVVTKIKESNHNIVIYPECGVSPFIDICKKIAISKKLKIKWVPIKFPRETVSDIYPILSNLLTNNERSIKKLLKEMCSTIPNSKLQSKKSSLEHTLSEVIINKYQNRVLEIFKGTKIEKLLSKRILYFDEYIDSGTTLRNTKYYLGYIVSNLNMDISAYVIKINNPKKYAKIKFAIYNKSSLLNAYIAGVYPFENRIDLIGYYYHLTDKEYIKIYLSDLFKEFSSSKANSNELIASMIDDINKKDLLRFVKTKAKFSQIKDYITINHIIQYYIYLLEKKRDPNGHYQEFLNQCFEMYAPIWSPMPIEYHIDYINAFKKLDSIIYGSNLDKIYSSYIKYRGSIFRKILKNYIKKRKQYLKNIANSIKCGKNEC